LQPTQQTVIPVILFNGPVAGDGSTTVTLNPAYDHVITGISAFTSVGEDDELYVFDSAYNYLLALLVPADPVATNLATANLVTRVVCQSLSGLVLISYSGSLLASLSADRLAPSATAIFS
jgi:hypothetical protein